MIYKKLWRALAALVMIHAAAVAGAAEITVACGSVGTDIEVCRKLMEDWTAKTGNKVRIFLTPNSSTDQLALYRQQFGARSGEVDVLMVDVVWPGIIKAGAEVTIKGFRARDASQNFVARPIDEPP